MCPRFYLWCFPEEVPKDKDGLLMPPGKGTQRTKVLMLVAFESGNVTTPLGVGCRVKEGMLEKRIVQNRHLKARHSKKFGVMAEWS